MICLEDKEKEELIKEIKELIIKTSKEEREKHNDLTEKFMHMFAESLSKEQDKGEITIKTVKEINKQYQYKEAIVIIALLIFLLVLYRI